MKLHIWITDEPLSDDADGDSKVYTDVTFVIGNNVHEARTLTLELAGVAHRRLLEAAGPPATEPQEPR